MKLGSCTEIAEYNLFIPGVVSIAAYFLKSMKKTLQISVFPALSYIIFNSYPLPAQIQFDNFRAFI